MVAVPAETPVMIPLVLPAVATDGAALDQLPPPAGSLSVIEDDGQTEDGPVMAGVAVAIFTVTVLVTLVGQPKALVTV